MVEYEKSYIEEIGAICAAHRAWAEGQSDGKRADLSFYELSNLKLVAINLKNAKLVGAGLTNCKLMDANLEQADLTNLRAAGYERDFTPLADGVGAYLKVLEASDGYYRRPASA